MTARFMKLCNPGRLLVPLFGLSFVAAITILSHFSGFSSGQYYLSEMQPKSPSLANPMTNSSFYLVVDNNASKFGQEGAVHQERNGKDIILSKGFSFKRNSSSVEGRTELFYILHNSTTQDSDQKHLASSNVKYSSSANVSKNISIVASRPSPIPMSRVRTSSTSASIRNSRKKKSKQVVLKGGLKNDNFNIEKYLRRMRRVKLVTLSEMTSMLLSGPKYSELVV